jgi:hypothetical protein
MVKAHVRGGLMSCSIDVEDHDLIEQQTEQGLVMGHAYGIIDVRTVYPSGLQRRPPVPLIRLRNPWGQVEWTGAWSNDANEWSQVSSKMRRKLMVGASNDGDFWMVSNLCPGFSKISRT